MSDPTEQEPDSFSDVKELVGTLNYGNVNYDSGEIIYEQNLEDQRSKLSKPDTNFGTLKQLE